MKNNKILIILSSLFLFSLNINAQDFETLEMNYEVCDFGVINCGLHTISIYDADTTIQGYSCHIIENNYFSDGFTYISYQGDSILLLNENNDFVLWYDFSVQVGDTVRFYQNIHDSYTVPMLITSVDYLYNSDYSDSLKQFHFEGVSNTQLQTSFIEHFGYDSYYIPLYGDEEVFIEFRCGLIDEKQFNLINEDCYDVSVSSIFSEQENIKTFPNPMLEQVVIDFANIQYQGKLKIELFDIAGQEHIARRSHSKVEQVYLDSSKLPKGIYYLSVSGEDGRYLFTTKMMK